MHAIWKFLVVLVISLTALSHGASHASSAEDPRLTDFINKFDELRAREDAGNWIDWLGPYSPVIPFLGAPYDEMLDQRDQELYLELQDSGDCLDTTKLDLIGFLLRYPFLNPAFFDRDRQWVFLSSIAKWTSRGYIRCAANRTLKQALRQAGRQKAEIPPLEFKPGIRSVRQYAPYAKSSTPEYEIFYSMRDLADVAFCGDYAPAIADLIAFISDGDLLKASPEQQYYVYERLRLVRKQGPDADPRRQAARAAADETYRPVIESAAASGDVVSLRWALPYWSDYCRTKSRFRWKHVQFGN